MIKSLLRKSAMPLSLAALLWAPMQLTAQTKAPIIPLTEADKAPVCMTRPMSNVAQVRHENRGQPFRILTIEGAAKALESKGFTRVDCRTADLVQADKRGGWRDEICELASTGNEAVQNQLTRAYGERPAVLCAAAEQVAGQWVRPSIRKPAPNEQE